VPTGRALRLPRLPGDQRTPIERRSDDGVASVSRRVLLVEDSRDLAELVSLHLADINCEVAVASDGARGLALAKSDRFDLIILDVLLPEIDGLEVCRALRSRRNYVPILMLTAKSSEIDRVLGLEIGADDYLVKPFSIAELLARVKALFRRVEEFARRETVDKGVVQAGPIMVDLDRRTVTIENRFVEFTAKEFDLLVEFTKHPGRVYTRSQLLDLVWGYGHGGYEHTVNCHINRLRGKIEKDQRHPAYILTVWGVGYKFNESAPS
jgi:DNA-binding response OmpR family regulator